MVREGLPASQLAEGMSPHDWLSAPVRTALETAESRVLAFASYERAWERIFTSEERARLGGSIFRYRQEHGVNLIQIYTQLRCTTQYRATIELAEQLNFLSASDSLWLLRETGSLEDAPSAVSRAPAWDRESYVLRLENVAIRTIKLPTKATNIVRILDSFEARGWPRRIEDPLPNGPDPIRLAAALRSLNQGLQQISFHKDGTGEGIRWQFE